MSASATLADSRHLFDPSAAIAIVGVWHVVTGPPGAREAARVVRETELPELARELAAGGTLAKIVHRPTPDPMALRLERDLAPLELPSTLTVELPTPAALAQHLATLLGPDPAEPGPAASPRPPARVIAAALSPAPSPAVPAEPESEASSDDADPAPDDVLAALEAALASANHLLAHGDQP